MGFLAAVLMALCLLVLALGVVCILGMQRDRDERQDAKIRALREENDRLKLMVERREGHGADRR